MIWIQWLMTCGLVVGSLRSLDSEESDGSAIVLITPEERSDDTTGISPEESPVMLRHGFSRDAPDQKVQGWLVNEVPGDFTEISPEESLYGAVPDPVTEGFLQAVTILIALVLLGLLLYPIVAGYILK